NAEILDETNDPGRVIRAGNIVPDKHGGSMSSIIRASLVLACGVLLLLGAATSCLAVGKDCPPCYVHCQEGPPKVKFKCACPRPVCSPCDSPFFGYYPTCWHPWGAGCPNCPSQNPPWVQ